MNRMPPPEGHHAHAGSHVAYDPSWRPAYPPTFDNHLSDPRRSANPQTTLPPQPAGYPVMPNRELPQLTPEGPYGRPNGHGLPLHAPVHSPQDPIPQNFHQPMNGAPHEASPDYRPRMGYPPPDQISSAEHTPVSGALPPASQFMTPVAQMASATPPAGYDQAFYQNQTFGARQRKANRATQACDQCRARKAKCDEGRPNCSHCKENNLGCVYKEVPPHKQEKTTQLVLDRLSQIENRMEERDNRMDERFEKMQMQMQEQLLNKLGNQPPPTVQERPSLPPPPPLIKQDPPFKTEMPRPHVPTPNILDPGSQYSQFGQNLGPMDPRLEDQREAEGELSIPVEHTTAAHKLLMWPSIKRLLHPEQYDEDYVMRLEEERGLLSIYGQGEISYTADDSQLPMDGDSKGSKGVRPDGDGAGPDADVDIDEFGNMKLDAATARRYYDSYIEHMFKLHPFLMMGELNIKVDNFIRCYCRPNTSPSSASSYTRLARDGPPPAKRRRSNENLGVRGEFMQTISNPPRPRVGKNIDNALVILCLALGAICEAPAPLPGPIMDKKIDYPNQRIPEPLPPFIPPPTLNGTYVTNGVLSPANSDSAAMQMSLSNSLYTVPTQPPGQSFPDSPLNKGIPGLSRRDVTNVQDEQGNTKNYQAIPGLTLYGYATAILGHLQGGNELEHVQCGLLAGLYAGQLAHPFQSHSWIYQASRACQVLVRTKRYERLEEGPTQDLYNFAYWTCLQLESDLLAELDIPASGISRSEGRMAIPKGKWTIILPNDLNAPQTMMMLFYSAQIHLRKVLNRVHTDLYKVEKQGQTRWSSTVQEALSLNLDLWRKSLPQSMQWDENDPPANEINAARMRAKYYGARYIIHRPLLYHALHYGHTGARVGPVGHSSVNSPTSQRLSPSMLHSARAPHMARMSSDIGFMPAAVSADWQPPKVRLQDLPRKLKGACDICIKSAIKSTEAFDGVGGHRLVVTNIFGTAHAQFGNMLVLSATFMSSLNELVEPEQLDRLLVRTIGFLIQSENISPTLRADARILTEIYTMIFHHPPDLRRVTSMSSHTPSMSSHTPSMNSQTTSMSFP
ncbi:transcriptional regulator family: Fungal Specific TF [Penicillium psychrosexuale]|uniref:transcriptional regulator family: Fungal Specific TF n=1 Tax=Penicillium psychrosexuale TaxID=1002107 RepID=UPI002545AF0E|nr:transcriptional regulator family: Fungal Specific TF [Penicillium psychrosexuale]KAJ5791330.1 transcriptional regulator family: Fungal Specific TF [Penicillium psychrosexuale]